MAFVVRLFIQDLKQSRTDRVYKWMDINLEHVQLCGLVVSQKPWIIHDPTDSIRIETQEELEVGWFVRLIGRPEPRGHETVLVVEWLKQVKDMSTELLIINDTINVRQSYQQPTKHALQLIESTRAFVYDDQAFDLVDKIIKGDPLKDDQDQLMKLLSSNPHGVNRHDLDDFAHLLDRLEEEGKIFEDENRFYVL